MSLTMMNRKKLLTGLTHDLYAAGWNQDCKMWFLLGEPGDEYLEYVGSFDLEPEHWLMHRAEEGELREHVHGVVVCYESWTYPHALNKMLKDNAVSHAYRRLVPPTEHPDGKDMRHLVLAARNGEVMRTTQYADNPDTVKCHSMKPTPQSGTPTGDSMIDYMRAMLGIFKPRLEQSMGAIIAQRPDLQEMIETARREQWDSDRVAGELFLQVDADIQRAMIRTMPDEVRAYLTTERNFDFTALADPTFEETFDDQS